MSYSYESEKPALFTEKGQGAFIKSRDSILAAMKSTRAIEERCAMRATTGFACTFEQLAVLDRMIELGDIERVEARGERYYVTRRVLG